MKLFYVGSQTTLPEFDMDAAVTQAKPALTILYDGQCPICSREIAWLRTRNSRCQLNFLDVHADGFDASKLGVTIDDLLAEIHAITANGCWLKGIDVFAHAYTLVGLEWLAAPLKWPMFRPLFTRLYALFARYRRRLRVRCQGKTCIND